VVEYMLRTGKIMHIDMEQINKILSGKSKVLNSVYDVLSFTLFKYVQNMLKSIPGSLGACGSHL
jgi:hypothetical protein